ncbi:MULTISPECIES: alpha-L-arabinofuranosidase C-terminal domain-containing protein [Leeuwenhoekiella]|jgi:alpha-N-arabinofuranosidase|uniref:alpha-L-arabinofuranosidase C-terminal domain-containing protein n=1 Tax=Leeuwenhoekiella TaxID=283735 RepID=UPI000E846F1D|nr:alpha-L-arabinofuranosidase C-terminal domain-containing protein [Leeuwenhoekiella blandensis]HBT10973.1 alpha-L-arabinofuranosidase [Leeuwenhoekiella sp.]|tara:strand:+ start:3080 stop:5074 length:1995 start_codon:yes stop_codon:yes gene_type:complete
MITQTIKKAGLAAVLAGTFLAGNTLFAQKELTVDMSETIAPIQPTMYGIFFEDINFAADGGLYAEMIKNRSFEFTIPMMGWSQPNSDRHSYNNESGFAMPVKYFEGEGNLNFLRVQVKNAEGYELHNEGFRGMGIKEGDTYRFTFDAKQMEGAVSAVKAELLDEEGNTIAEASIPVSGSEWANYKAEIVPNKTVMKGSLKLTFEGTGELGLDMVSLFPTDTWNGRENGLRKDLVQLLYDLDPGFLRFPGGCIVEGRTLARRYQWKKTVGPVDERPSLVNRWNTEFDHRLTPDYYQSFGLGFFEYFQLSEDLGAEPLPILSCGIACQFNTGELVPMDELDPYVQDALDLIEFANGSTDTPWGKVRADMGHPEPFNMKYIGVGNEQWGPEYIERYKVFNEAIAEKYPEIIIVSGSGPFPDGDYFEYGMKELKKIGAEIIDEHYYRSPEWFRENATRYDSYDRNGPKIFAGEYAAQTVAIASPDNKNSWDAALSEAAFMTGLERNAEVVQLTSYAPLMAHADGWQWTPDMIWFNNLESYGTPNYYVQKLYATNRGTDLISVTQDGENLVGQDELYASATLDTEAKEVVVKVVNTSSEAQEVTLNFDGKKLKGKGKAIVLKEADLNKENSFESQQEIAPVTEELKVKKDVATYEVSAYSLNIIRIPLK